MQEALRPDIAATVDAIGPLDTPAMAAARARHGRLTEPAGSLGRLEELAIRLRDHRPGDPTLTQKAVVVMAGDHGVTAGRVAPTRRGDRADGAGFSRRRGHQRAGGRVGARGRGRCRRGGRAGAPRAWLRVGCRWHGEHGGGAGDDARTGDGRHATGIAVVEFAGARRGAGGRDGRDGHRQHDGDQRVPLVLTGSAPAR